MATSFPAVAPTHSAPWFGLKTLHLKVHPSCWPWLDQAAREVNTVWNYANATRRLAARPFFGSPRYLSAYDLDKLVAGCGEVFERIGIDVAQRVVHEFVTRCTQEKQAGLRFRKSGGSRRSLGWIPFKGANLRLKGDRLRFLGKPEVLSGAASVSGNEVGFPFSPVKPDTPSMHDRKREDGKPSHEHIHPACRPPPTGLVYGGVRICYTPRMYAALRQMVPQSSADAVDGAALLALIPALTPLATTPQDPVFHAEGDVWTHTLLVLDALKNLDGYRSADDDTRFVLFAAALLHDIAKPSCTVLEPEGRVSSAGHSRRGAIDTRVLLWRAGVPFALRERICRIVATHQVPFFMLGRDRRGRRPEFTLHQLSWEGRFADLHAVAEADMRGRMYVDQANALADLDLVRVLAEEDNCWLAPRVFPDDHTRLTYFRSSGAVSPDHAFHQPPGSRVTVLSGLPASGKNTWAARHRKDWPVVSFDDAKAELGLKPGDAAGAAVHRATDRAKSFLRGHEPFVWNATHLSPSMRQKTLDLLFAYGAEVEIVYLEAPERVIKDRNRRRNTTLTNAAIDGMLNRWDIPLPWEAHRVRYEVEPG